MYDLPFQQTPTNFPEEEKLLCRIYRVAAILEVLEETFQKKRPRLARDLAGVGNMLDLMTSSVESQLNRPKRLRVWLDRETQAKRPPPSIPLLIRLLAITRRASTSVLNAHNAAVRLEEEGKESCWCYLCHNVYEIRWLLGTTSPW
jgi:hypothetical protein